MLSEDDVRAAAMMIECGCDRGWVANHLGIRRDWLNKLLYRLKLDRRARMHRWPG